MLAGDATMDIYSMSAWVVGSATVGAAAGGIGAIPGAVVGGLVATADYYIGEGVQWVGGAYYSRFVAPHMPAKNNSGGGSGSRGTPPRNDLQAHNLYPATSNSKTTSGVSKTVDAGQYAQNLNAQQTKKPAPPTAGIERLEDRIDGYRDKIKDLEKKIKRLESREELSANQRKNLRDYKKKLKDYKKKLKDARADLKDLKAK